MTVGELLAASSRVDNLTADRDEWKARARKAESELKELRRSLRALRVALAPGGAS